MGGIANSTQRLHGLQRCREDTTPRGDYRPLSKSSGYLGFSVNTGNEAITNLGTGAVSGLSTDFIMKNVKSPSASFVLFLGTDMVMKFNANQINKVAND